MTTFYKIISIIFMAVVVTGCIGKIGLDPAFWENKTSTIAICIVPYPLEGHTFRYVSGGFLPGYTTEIHSVDAGLTNFVKNFDNSEFDGIKSMFSNEFIKRGMQVLPLDDTTFSSVFHDLKINKSPTSEVLSTLKKQTNADYLIVFGVPEWGIRQEGYPLFTKYYGFISMNGILIDLSNGEVKWRNMQSRRQVRVLEEWNQPPEYPNVTKAIHEVITVVAKELYDSFFATTQFKKD
jgi:hypothetical protein